MIAGHNFIDDRCDCGRKWIDIMHADETYFHADGYAHSGLLNMEEITQITQERLRREAIYSEATKSASSGGGVYVTPNVPATKNDSEAETW